MVVMVVYLEYQPMMMMLQCIARCCWWWWWWWWISISRLLIWCSMEAQIDMDAQLTRISSAKLPPPTSPQPTAGQQPLPPPQCKSNPLPLPSTPVPTPYVDTEAVLWRHGVVLLCLQKTEKRLSFGKFLPSEL